MSPARRNHFLSIFIIFIAGTGCNSIYKSKQFKVVDATENVIFPGVYGSPISHHFLVYAVAKKKQNLQADSFWAEEFREAVRLRFADGREYSGAVNKGDTLLFDMYYFEAMPNQFPEEIRTVTGSGKDEPPVKHKGRLLFRYTADGGAAKYYSVDTFRKIDNIYAP